MRVSITKKVKMAIAAIPNQPRSVNREAQAKRKMISTSKTTNSMATR